MKRKTVAMIVLITLAGVDPASASKGEKAFADGDFLAASKFYTEALKKNPDDPRLHYNAGTAAYKNNLYDDAIASFTQALKSEDLGLQEQTYYNLGNALFKKGEEILPKEPQQAAKLWQQALDAYDGSLKLHPQGRDSKENLDLVTRRLEELKKQQQDKQNQDKPQQYKNDKPKQEKQQEQQKEKPQAGDQQGQEGKQGQPEKQDDQGQKQGKDPAAAQDESSPPEKKSGDQAGSKEQSAEKPAGKEQHPEQTEAAQAAEAQNDDQQQKESAADQAGQRSQSGKMTGEEARQLLNRLKDEEGRLNFVPQPENGEAGKEGTWKDW